MVQPAAHFDTRSRLNPSDICRADLKRSLAGDLHSCLTSFSHLTILAENICRMFVASSNVAHRDVGNPSKLEPTQTSTRVKPCHYAILRPRSRSPDIVPLMVEDYQGLRSGSTSTVHKIQGSVRGTKIWRTTVSRSNSAARQRTEHQSAKTFASSWHSGASGMRVPCWTPWNRFRGPGDLHATVAIGAYLTVMEDGVGAGGQRPDSLSRSYVETPPVKLTVGILQRRWPKMLGVPR